jgi:hypothetical protein
MFVYASGWVMSTLAHCSGWVYVICGVVVDVLALGLEIWPFIGVAVVVPVFAD